MCDIIPFIDNLVLLQKNDFNLFEGNEAQTRWSLIDPLFLDGLGYLRKDILVEYNISTLDEGGKHNRLDYSIMLNNKPKILVEAKSLGVNVYEHYQQLYEYSLDILSRHNYELSELIAILTNGDTYLFYCNSTRLDSIDVKPFFTIQLSSSDDLERLRLLDFTRENLLSSKPITVDEGDCEGNQYYELGVSYRIDMIEEVYNYFMSQGRQVEINKIYLKGRVTRLTSYSKLYQHLISEINGLNPSLLYELAVKESNARNGTISSIRFSLTKQSASDKQIMTKLGVVYISVPSNIHGLIERIVYLAEQSYYGLSNILVSLK
jgi:hypothetical protein